MLNPFIFWGNGVRFFCFFFVLVCLFVSFVCFYFTFLFTFLYFCKQTTLFLKTLYHNIMISNSEFSGVPLPLPWISTFSLSFPDKNDWIIPIFLFNSIIHIFNSSEDTGRYNWIQDRYKCYELKIGIYIIRSNCFEITLNLAEGKKTSVAEGEACRALFACSNPYHRLYWKTAIMYFVYPAI